MACSWRDVSREPETTEIYVFTHINIINVKDCNSKWGCVTIGIITDYCKNMKSTTLLENSLAVCYKVKDIYLLIKTLNIQPRNFSLPKRKEIICS